jgi:hypothetical protein
MGARKPFTDDADAQGNQTDAFNFVEAHFEHLRAVLRAQHQHLRAELVSRESLTTWGSNRTSCSVELRKVDTVQQ